MEIKKFKGLYMRTLSLDELPEVGCGNSAAQCASNALRSSGAGAIGISSYWLGAAAPCVGGLYVLFYTAQCSSTGGGGPGLPGARRRRSRNK